MADMSELLAVVGRLKRTMPRHFDVLELDRLVTDLFTAKNLERPKKGPVDRKTYQRELMRKRRAAKVKRVPATDPDRLVIDEPKSSMTKEERLEWLRDVLPERLQAASNDEEPNPFDT